MDSHEQLTPPESFQNDIAGAIKGHEQTPDLGRGTSRQKNEAYQKMVTTVEQAIQATGDPFTVKRMYMDAGGQETTYYEAADKFKESELSPSLESFRTDFAKLVQEYTATNDPKKGQPPRSSTICKPL